MAYTPTVWKNGEFPPIDAEHLNKIEQGIANSAPGGFGLGTTGQAVTDFDTVHLNGWYYGAPGTAHAPDNENGWSVRVTNIGNSNEICIQDAYTTVNTNKYLHCRRLVYINTATQNNPWEWVNPPMELGVEYRTTERYLGKPVYTKLLDGDFEAWRPDGQSDWASAGKAVLFSIEKGGTKNISLTSNHTYIFSATDNVHSGVAIVQVDSSSIQAITPLVSSVNWKIEAGSGLSVNVTETDGRYGVTVSAMML